VRVVWLRGRREACEGEVLLGFASGVGLSEAEGGGVVNAEVVPVYMLDQAIVELRSRAGARDSIPVGEAVDVLLELRDVYGVDVETAEHLLVMLGYRERKR
jgi:hypothetical protein